MSDQNSDGKLCVNNKNQILAIVVESNHQVIHFFRPDECIDYPRGEEIFIVSFNIESESTRQELKALNLIKIKLWRKILGKIFKKLTKYEVNQNALEALSITLNKFWSKAERGLKDKEF